MQNGGHHKILQTVADEADHDRPRRSGDRRGGENDEGQGHAALDGE